MKDKSKNRYSNRKTLSQKELELLFNRFLESGWTQSLFTGKKFINEGQFWNDLSRNIDRNGCKYFKYLWYLIHIGLHKCKGCEKDISEYELFKNKNVGFRDYCNVCVENAEFNKNWSETRIAEMKSKRNYDEIGKKISKSKIEFFQSDYGKKVAERVGEINSVKMKLFNKTPKGIANLKRVAEKNSKIMKEKIVNGEFTPNITNSWTSWNASIIFEGGVKKFRSSWEACVWNSNKHLEYESVRIPYVTSSGENKTYVVDFFDRKLGILYEIKPRCNWKKFNEKMQAVIEYCKQHSLKFIWINEGNILSFVNEEDFQGENLEQYKKLLNGVT